MSLRIGDHPGMRDGETEAGTEGEVGSGEEASEVDSGEEGGGEIGIGTCCRSSEAFVG